MKLFDVELYKNTPFINQNNAVYFGTQNTMQNWFTNNFEHKNFGGVNITWDKRVLKLPIRLDDLLGFNYGKMTFGPNNQQFRYFFVTNMIYNNDGMTEIEFLTDPIQTNSYGNRIRAMIGRTTITNQHPESYQQYQNDLLYLNTNDDVLSSTANIFSIKQDAVDFGVEGYYVVFTSTVDLSADPGNVDEPKMETSVGQVYDHLQSPQNLYVAGADVYNTMMKAMKKYPWISRNITANSQIPTKFVDTNDLESVETTAFGTIKKFKSGSESANISKLWSYNISDIRALLHLADGKREDFLLRYPYTYVEVMSNQGELITIKLEDLDPAADTIQLDAKTMTGYDNGLTVYPASYLSNGENILSGFVRGEGMGMGLHFNNWYAIPTLIDNYIAKKADTAYSRDLAQDRTLAGRVKDITSRNASLADRFTDAMDIAGVGLGAGSAIKGGYDRTNNSSMTRMGGNLAIAGGIGKAAMGVGTRLTDDHMKMQDIQAQLNQAKISSPTLQNQNMANTFNMANNIFGIQIKIKTINQEARDVIRNYHKRFGFKYGKYDYINQFNMPVVNYVKCEVEHLLPSQYLLPQEMELLKTRLDAGQMFWQPVQTDAAQVFNQDITNNLIRN